MLVLELKLMEQKQSLRRICSENKYIFVAEWEWNGGEDLKGEQLKEARMLFNKLITSEVNKQISELSNEITETEDEYRKRHGDCLRPEDG